MLINEKNVKELLSNKFNSYKIFWFKGIVEEVLNGNKEINFRDIIIRMICDSWNLLMNNNINLGKKDKLNGVIREIDDLYSLGKNINLNTQYILFKDIKDEEFEKLIDSFYEYAD